MLHKYSIENKPFFATGFVLPATCWIPGLERQVSVGSSSHCATFRQTFCYGRSAAQVAVPYAALSSL